MTDKNITDRFENLLTKRSDTIDNAIYNMLLEILGENEESMPWDMEIIGNVADAVEVALPDFGKHLCRPYIGEGESPCFKLHECKCATCPMKQVQT